jgi:hypothetical protein
MLECEHRFELILLVSFALSCSSSSCSYFPLSLVYLSLSPSVFLSCMLGATADCRKRVVLAYTFNITTVTINIKVNPGADTFAPICCTGSDSHSYGCLSYETMKRELNKDLYECRCDERLKAKLRDHVGCCTAVKQFWCQNLIHVIINHVTFSTLFSIEDGRSCEQPWHQNTNST